MAETCAGCGAEASSHPYVGVARDDETNLMTSYPVCYWCWSDPTHRQVTLKMHFFPSTQAEEAVVAAEDNILVEKP
jgi:hypothetical protein